MAAAAVTSNRPSGNARDELEPGDALKDSSSRPGTRHQSGNVAYSTQQEAGIGTAMINGNGPSGSSAPTSSNERGGVSDTSGGVSEEAESEVDDIDSQVRSSLFCFLLLFVLAVH